MAFTYGPDGIIIRSGGGIGTGLYGHVQGQLGEKNDAATIAEQIRQMNQAAKQLQQQGRPNLGDAAPVNHWQPPAPAEQVQVSKPITLYADPAEVSRRQGGMALDGWLASRDVANQTGDLSKLEVDPKTGLPIIPGSDGATPWKSVKDPDDTSTPGSDAPGGMTPDAQKAIDDGRTKARLDAAGDATDRQWHSEEVRKANLTSSARQVEGTTIKAMLEDLKKDPAYNPDKMRAGQLLADQFHDNMYSKDLTEESLRDNPLLRELNNVSVWSKFRREVADWYDKKNKAGTIANQDNGDGSFAGMVTGSFSQATGTGNIPALMVATDEHGMQYVTTADKWIDAKYAKMRQDPVYAGQMITALAAMQSYGSASTGNTQGASRVVTDGEGNPIKGFAAKEDLNALKDAAEQIARLQLQGNEGSVDDVLAEFTKQAYDVYKDPQMTYSGSGGGGGYSRWGGGGFGGGGGAVQRLTDPTQLVAQINSEAQKTMGRDLDPAQAAEFASFYNGLEQQMYAQLQAGGPITTLDPQGQAQAWIAAHYGKEKAGEAGGEMAAAFMKMIGAGGFAGALSIGKH